MVTCEYSTMVHCTCAAETIGPALARPAEPAAMPMVETSVILKFHPVQSSAGLIITQYRTQLG